MNMMSASRDKTAHASRVAGEGRGILVWDAPVRVFHWLMVLCFAGAYLTAESESLRLVHVTLGYSMAGLVVFRIVWGMVGSRYARFSNFVRGPAAAARYLRSLVSARPEHYVGHNPAGALAILALLGAALLLVLTGWANYNDVAGHWVEELHEGIANSMLTLVVIHIGAVLASSWLHGENLIKAMVSGRKPGSSREGIRRPRRLVAVALLAAVLGFWAWQWQSAPAPAAGQHPGAIHHEHD